MKILLLILFVPTLCQAQEKTILFGPKTSSMQGTIDSLAATKADKSTVIVVKNLLTDLKNEVLRSNAIYFMIGRDSLGDGKGGFFMYDASSIDTEDLTYLNIVASNVMGVGRLRRIFARRFTIPQGTFVIDAGVGRLYAPATTSNGEYTLNLTFDNTATGKPLFKEIWFNDSKSTLTAATPSDAVSSYVKSLSGNLKTTTHGFFKANALTLTLGLLYSPFASAGSGVPVQFEITGLPNF